MSQAHRDSLRQPPGSSIANLADLANADANNEPGRARIYLDQLATREHCEQASPTIVDPRGQP
jgi:hypothetical protein